MEHRQNLVAIFVFISPKNVSNIQLSTPGQRARWPETLLIESPHFYSIHEHPWQS